MSEAAARYAGEMTIRVLSFDGKDEAKFDEWYTKKLAIARKRGYREVLLSDELEIPSDSEIVAGAKEDGTVLSDEEKLNYKLNSLAYSDLVLDLSGTALHYAEKARTDSLAEGDARLAIRNQLERYKPGDEDSVVEWETKLQALELSPKMNIEKWLQEVEKLENKIEKATGNRKTDVMKKATCWLACSRSAYTRLCIQRYV